MKRSFIIAEAGVNHNGSLERALEMVDAAARAGADAVKFQTFRAEELVVESAPKANYQQKNTDSSESQFQMLKKLELGREDFRLLAERAKEKGILFLSTPFDAESLRMLLELKMEIIKIPSGEIVNPVLLTTAAESGLPIILSTGMATLDEVKEAVALLEKNHCGPLTLMHCTTEYPTAYADVNLRVLATLKETFPQAQVGYSDHTPGIIVSLAAAVLGAAVIEKHFTLDRNLPGPDHVASLNLDELAALVHDIRALEDALGNGVKIPAASEWPNRAIARRSLVAAKPIRQGELFTGENLVFRRPGSGISPMRIGDYLGHPAGHDYRKDELIDE